MKLTQKEEILRDAIKHRGYLSGHPHADIDYVAHAVSYVLDDDDGMADYELRDEGFYICVSATGRDAQPRYMARVLSWPVIANAKFDVVGLTRIRMEEKLHRMLYGDGSQ